MHSCRLKYARCTNAIEDYYYLFIQVAPLLVLPNNEGNKIHFIKR